MLINLSECIKVSTPSHYYFRWEEMGSEANVRILISTFLVTFLFPPPADGAEGVQVVFRAFFHRKYPPRAWK